MRTGDRAAVKLGSVFSVVAGVWALANVALPFGIVAGPATALFGLAFGGLAVLAHAWGGWRKAAFVGIAMSTLTLLFVAALLVYAVLAE
jgi:hypothetical protein